MSRRMSLGGRTWLLFGVFAAAAHPAPAADSQGPSPRLPPAVEQALWWLPEDTETLVVARPFVFPPKTEAESQLEPSWRSIAILGALNGLVGDDKDRPADAFPADHFARLRYESMVMGGRSFEVVTSFGGFRSENCVVLRLAEGSTPDGEWLASLRGKARRVERIGGRDVLAFPIRFMTEPWYRPTEWQGAFVVVLDVRTILVATSDRLLREVLPRVDRKPATRALPDTLPEWREVDPGASCWLVRHEPRPKPDLGAAGVVVTWKDEGFRVAYPCQPGRRVDPDIVRNFWCPSDAEGPRQRSTFEARSDGSFALTHESRIGADPSDLWIAMALSSSMGRLPPRPGAD